MFYKLEYYYSYLIETGRTGRGRDSVPPDATHINRIGMHFLNHFIIVFVVGFERTSYTVNETDGTVEVCVVVTNPPPTEDLVSLIFLTVQTRDVTAIGNYKSVLI